MAARPTVLERAFELARSGDCAGVQDIRHKLRAEGHLNAEAQLYGRSLLTQLKRICDEARAKRASGN
jgi:hypothetical protein